MSGINWQCPHCRKDVVITAERYSNSTHFNVIKNSDGSHGITTEFFICTNPNCKKYTLIASLYNSELEHGNFGNRITLGDPTKIWNLIPSSNSQNMPSYIPAVLLNDYYEACEIKNLSPKASATLSRRCLQGMIRDFWKVTEKNLFEEIKSIKEKIDPLTWSAIDSVRSIGNIGAHMEKDINFIIDVEPQEAELLINLIETLFEDWYINKYEREQRMKKITNLSKEKKELKKQKNS